MKVSSSSSVRCWRRLSMLGVAFALSSGCSAILGIEEATCNPSLADCRNALPDGSLPDSGAPAPLCEEFCDVVMESCSGSSKMYHDRRTCLSVCELLPAGEEGDENVNSVQCRLRQARVTVEPPIDCPGAGIGGDGICGDNCEALCKVMIEVCTEFTAYQTFSDCMADCDGILDTGGFDFEKDETSGNTVQCRLWHAAAATQLKERHCPHARGDTPCAD